MGIEPVTFTTPVRLLYQLNYIHVYTKPLEARWWGLGIFTQIFLVPIRLISEEALGVSCSILYIFSVYNKAYNYTIVCSYTKFSKKLIIFNIIRICSSV